MVNGYESHGHALAHDLLLELYYQHELWGQNISEEDKTAAIFTQELKEKYIPKDYWNAGYIEATTKTFNLINEANVGDYINPSVISRIE
jgi:hypothetical protein